MASLKFSDTPQYSDKTAIPNGKPITLIRKSCVNKNPAGFYIKDTNGYYTKDNYTKDKYIIKDIYTNSDTCNLINGTLKSSKEVKDPDGHDPTIIEYTVRVGNTDNKYLSAEYFFQVYYMKGGYRRNRTKRNRNRKRKQSRKH